MKLFLFIIFWMFVPTITQDGIKIGEILLNNQKIKIMKMNFNNPAWLQSASSISSKVPETRFVFVEGENQVQLSANGDVTIESMQGGEIVRETYIALNNTDVTINADEGTDVVIYGAVTAIKSNGNIFASLDLSKSVSLTELYCTGCTDLTSLDLSKNAALTYLNCVSCWSLLNLDLSNNIALTELDCSGCIDLTSLDLSKNAALTGLYCGGCTGLTSLDLSKNAALTYLDCSDCQNLLMLNIKNTAVLNRGTILDQSMATLTTLQVAGTSAWAYEQVESWLRDYAPDNGTIYVDENTPQGVITEAQGKSWTIEYVNQ